MSTEHDAVCDVITRLLDGIPVGEAESALVAVERRVARSRRRYAFARATAVLVVVVSAVALTGVALTGDEPTRISAEGAPSTTAVPDRAHVDAVPPVCAMPRAPEAYGDPQGCNDPWPPPTSGEEPDDVETARAAVIEAYRIVHDGSLDPEVRAPMLDDPTGFVEMTREIRAEFGGPAFDARLGAIDVVFMSASTAAVQFTVIASSGTFPFRGEAVLTTDGWKMSRDTWCTEIELAGKDCPLGAPGAEQPVDVEAARAAVIEAYRIVHDGSLDPEIRAAMLDDPTGFVEVTNAVRAEFGAPATDARLGDIEVVFTSGSSAAVQFTVVSSTGAFPFRGEAVLTSDGWKAARSTWCEEIVMAGHHC